MTKLLFLITRYPYPASSGDLIYNVGLIEALAASPGVKVDVFCGELKKADAASPPAGATWYYGSQKGRLNDFRILFTSLPRTVVRCHSPRDVRAIAGMISKNDYDAVLISEASAGSGVEQFAKVVTGTKTQTIYVSHNVDNIIRVEAAAELKHPVKRLLAQWDGRKAARLESRLLKYCTSMTAISEQDSLDFDKLAPYLAKEVIKPGYSGQRKMLREITADMPRQAVLVGSFDWYVKQINLFELLSCHDDLKCSGQISFGLRIAGRIPPSVITRIEQQYPETDLRPSFIALKDVLGDARLALVLERLGSGFKLKILDYIFSRVPVVAFPGAMAGSNLEPGVDYADAEDIIDALLRAEAAIDDFPSLNAMQNTAFAKAVNNFNWNERARSLLHFIEEQAIS